MNYKKSVFLAQYCIDGRTIVVNTRSKRIFVVTEEVYNNLLHNDVLALLQRQDRSDFINNGFLVPEDKNEAGELEQQCIEQDNDSEWNSLHIIPTTRCNMGCKYCFVLKDMDGKARNADLDQNTLRRAIDLFVEDNPSKKKAMTFYGGEAFVNEKIIYEAVRYGNEKYPGVFQYKIVTNGTLITKENSSFLSKNGFDVNLSLDGDMIAQDAFRTYKNGASTYLHVIQGLKLLMEAGNSVKVLMTVGDFNIPRLEECVESILLLSPTSIALNLPKQLQHEDNEIEHNLQIEELCRKYFLCLDMCYSYKIPEAHYADIIYGFLSDELHYRPCSGCGKQIAVSPYNMVGPCQAYLSTGKYFVDFSLINTKKQLRETSEFDTWKKITMYRSNKCRNCYLLPVCPGDCPFDWENRTGSFENPPDIYCITRKAMFKNLIERIVKKQPVLFKKQRQ